MATNWKEYTTKTNPEDTDEIMIADTKANANKRTPLSGLWNWIAGKLATAVISQLETQNKSIIPALNELNSKAMNYRKLHYYRIMQTEGKTQTFTFTDCEEYRSPFIYVHGSQIPNKTTIAIGMLKQENNDVTIGFVSKLHGEAEISFQNNTIISESNESWSNGFVIY